MNATTTLPPDWQPSPAKRAELREAYGREIDLSLALAKFRAYHSEGQTSRNWDARFTTWVLTDIQRVRERTRGGTDDLGVPLTQRPAERRVLQPGDEGYVSLDDLAETARQQATKEDR